MIKMIILINICLYGLFVNGRRIEALGQQHRWGGKGLRMLKFDAPSQPRHSREGGNPALPGAPKEGSGIPAFAGMTVRGYFEAVHFSNGGQL